MIKRSSLSGLIIGNCLWLLFLLVLNGQIAQAQAPLTTKPFIGRIYYDAAHPIERLWGYRTIDVHEYNNSAERYLLATLDSASYALLQQDGWRVEIDATATQANARYAIPHSQTPSTYYGGYRTVSEINQILDITAQKYPSITQLVDYGDSYCKKSRSCVINGSPLAGYDLRAIRIANKNNPDAPIGSGKRPVFVLMAAIHARELTTTEQTLFFLDLLVSQYGKDPNITWMIDWQDIYIIPVANPDGRFVVETVDTPGWQRKNANTTNGLCNNWWSQYSVQPGIDLNRNHSFGWGPIGASDDPCSLIYHGPSAASEPEVAMLEQYLRTLFPDQRGAAITDAAPADTTGILITLHSYSDLVLWPWGNTPNLPPNSTGLERIGRKFGALTGYHACQTAEPNCIYLVSGDTGDWVYGTLGIPSYTFEIGDSNDGFFPPYTVAQNSHWNEVKTSFLYAASIARMPYILAEGPDVTQISHSVSVLLSDTLTVSAEVDDTQNGGQLIKNAIYTIDTPSWQTDAISYTLNSADGNLDSSAEEMWGMVSYCNMGLNQGDHTLYLRGQDAAGNWGPTSAVTFTIDTLPDCVATTIEQKQLDVAPARQTTVLFSLVATLLFSLVFLKKARRGR